MDLKMAHFKRTRRNAAIAMLLSVILLKYIMTAGVHLGSAGLSWTQLAKRPHPPGEKKKKPGKVDNDRMEGLRVVLQ